MSQIESRRVLHSAPLSPYLLPAALHGEAEMFVQLLTKGNIPLYTETLSTTSSQRKGVEHE
jgi:hypothetical protein